MTGGDGGQQLQLQTSCTREPRIIGSTTSTMASGTFPAWMACLQRQLMPLRLEKLRALVSPPNMTSRFEKMARPVTVVGRPPAADASAMTR